MTVMSVRRAFIDICKHFFKNNTFLNDANISLVVVDEIPLAHSQILKLGGA